MEVVFQTFTLSGIKRASDRELLLFGGEKGVDLARGGCSAVQVPSFKSVDEVFCALRPVLIDKYSCALRPAP